jgi:hypothetical protein
VLVTFLNLDDSHAPSVDGGPSGKGSGEDVTLPRGVMRDPANMTSLLERIRMRARARAIRRVARLLVELEALSAARRA